MMKYNLSLPGCGLSGHFERIANGENSLDGLYPFIAMLYRYSIPIGAAIIINERWLLSAAHNFITDDDDDLPKSYSIGVGSIDVKRLKKKKIDRIILHEKFRKHRQNYDIAMIRLKKPLQFGQMIRPICLPDYYSNRNINQIKRGRIIGWGYRNFNQKTITQILQQVDLDIFPIDKCHQIYLKFNLNIMPSQICTFTVNKDACTGDSGGPFFIYKNNRAILLGIIGFGVTCADNFPGVITSVSHFIDWIDKILIMNQK